MVHLTKKKDKPQKNNIKIPELTVRELEIIKLIWQEYSTAEIAEKLFLSKFTIETHRKNILKKTNSKTIIGLVKYAVKHKLI